MFNPRRLVIAVGLALLVGVTASCSSVDDKDVQSSQTATALPQAYGIPPSQKPRLQDDFYDHVNFDYLTGTKLPAYKAEVNNMVTLHDQTKDTIKDILKQLNQDYAKLTKGSDEQKVIDFYNMAMDFKTRDKLGLKPVQARLDAVKAAKSKTS